MCGYYNQIMTKILIASSIKRENLTEILLKVFTAAIAVCALLLTFTISDYYIFNRMTEYGILFCISQWVKKAGVLLLVMAVFYKRQSCAQAAKYFLPLFVILSCFLFGNFFDITKVADTVEQEIYNSINLFVPKWLNVTIFYLQNALYIFTCALLFTRDGIKISWRALLFFALSMLACMPLNIFENFFDITTIPANSILRFKNFSIWHFLAIAMLAAFTIGCYYFLRNKSERDKNAYLCALAVAMLIQYHSKDSVMLGDGYNVYHTIFACIPLFICNIGVYVAALSVFTKKKTLYAISFFIHAVGALSVFVYFGKDDMSNYGIFCSYSFLFFTITHACLFALSVLPSALGQYKFKFKDCIVPLIYYFVVIILASICSALVTSASMTWHTQDGYYLPLDGLLKPNYAFTQINPLPFEVPPVITLTVWKYQINVLYILGLYAAYVALFFAFTGAYYAFLAIRKKYLAHVSRSQASEKVIEVTTAAYSELASSENDQIKTDDK
jgi:hypothetical protein